MGKHVSVLKASILYEIIVGINFGKANSYGGGL